MPLKLAGFGASSPYPPYPPTPCSVFSGWQRDVAEAVKTQARRFDLEWRRTGNLLVLHHPVKPDRDPRRPADGVEPGVYARDTGDIVVSKMPCRQVL